MGDRAETPSMRVSIDGLTFGSMNITSRDSPTALIMFDEVPMNMSKTSRSRDDGSMPMGISLIANNRLTWSRINSAQNQTLARSYESSGKSLGVVCQVSSIYCKMIHEPAQEPSCVQDYTQ
ncbi:hypothetical protein Droror1_Dr00012221 [Drosera rotundifolia]